MNCLLCTAFQCLKYINIPLEGALPIWNNNRFVEFCISFKHNNCFKQFRFKLQQGTVTLKLEEQAVNLKVSQEQLL